MVKSKKRDSEDTDMEDATQPQPVEDEEPVDQAEEPEDDEEEYEIEAILDAKHGHFPGVRTFTFPTCSLCSVTRTDS